MDDLYKYLNEIETDFSEYEDEALSPEEVSRINSRINRKLNLRKKKANRTLTWVSRAAILTFCCLAVGGGVYAATTLRKNTANNLRIKSSQSEVVDVDGNKVTKKIYDEETGGELTYDVITEGTSTDAASADDTSIPAQNAGPDLIEQIKKDGIADAEIESISKQDNTIKVIVNMELDDASKFEPLRDTFDHFADQGIAVAMNNETFDNFSLTSRLDDTEMRTWVNNYSLDGNKLSIEVDIDTYETKAVSEGTDPNWPMADDYGISPFSELSEEESIEATTKYDEALKKYEDALPDPLSCTISFDLNFGKDLGGTYTFITRLGGSYEDVENDRIPIDEVSAEASYYNMHTSINITSYSVGANGIEFQGTCSEEGDINELYAKCEQDGMLSYFEELYIIATDDLGNSYLLYPERDFSDEALDEDDETDPFTPNIFTASICDDGRLPDYSKASGLNFKTNWASGVSSVTFQIAKFNETYDINHELEATFEYMTDPVTIDVK